MRLLCAAPPASHMDLTCGSSFRELRLIIRACGMSAIESLGQVDEERFWRQRTDARGSGCWHDEASGAIRWDSPCGVLENHERWEQRWTTDSTTCLYCNTQTGAVSWDPPEQYDMCSRPSIGSASWVRLATDDGHPFYQNVVTNDVSWDKPDSRQLRVDCDWEPRTSLVPEVPRTGDAVEDALARSHVGKTAASKPPASLQQRVVSLLWRLSSISRLCRVVQVAELHMTSKPNGGACARLGIWRNRTLPFEDITMLHFVPPLAGALLALRLKTQKAYVKLFLRENGLEFLLRAMIVVHAMRRSQTSFVSVVTEGLITNCVSTLLAHDDLDEALVCQTLGLELLFADTLLMSTHWQHITTTLHVLVVLARKRRCGDTHTAEEGRSQIVWDVIELLRVRGRERSEASTDRPVVLIPAVVAKDDRTIEKPQAKGLPFSLALEPPRFYGIVCFLLPTVPLAVSKMSVSLLRTIAASLETSMERRRVRAEMSYAMNILASTQGINGSVSLDASHGSNMAVAGLGTCFASCSLLWLLRRRAAARLNDGETVGMERADRNSRALSINQCNVHSGAVEGAADSTWKYLPNAKLSSSYAEALEIVNTIDQLETDESEDMRMELASSSFEEVRSSHIAAMIQAEAAANGPIIAALADALASTMVQTCLVAKDFSSLVRLPLLKSNPQWEAGVAALNGTLARLTMLRKASRDDDEVVQWQIEASLGNDELNQADKKFVETQKIYDELTTRADVAQRLCDLFRSHPVITALYSVFDASDSPQGNDALAVLRREVGKVKSDSRRGTHDDGCLADFHQQLLDISSPFLDGGSRVDCGNNRRVPVLAARRLLLAATWKHAAEAARLRSEVALTEASLERWRQRRDSAPGRMLADIESEIAWAEEKATALSASLAALRRCLPVDVSRRTAAEVRDAAHERYASAYGSSVTVPIYPLRLCEHLVMHKLLHVAILHGDDMVKGDFLRHGYEDAPERLVEQYTLGELSAVYAAVAAAAPPSPQLEAGGCVMSKVGPMTPRERAVRHWRASLVKVIQKAEEIRARARNSAVSSRTTSVSRSKLVETLSRVEGLRALTQAQVERVAASVEVETYAPSSYIVKQGDMGTCFFVISRGECSCVRGNDDGSETELVRLGVDAYFGERALLRDEPRAAHVKSVGAVTVMKITRAVFDDVRSSIEAPLGRRARTTPRGGAAGARGVRGVLARLALVAAGDAPRACRLRVPDTPRGQRDSRSSRKTFAPRRREAR